MAALLFIALFSETQIPDVPSPSCSPASQELAQQGASEATEPRCAPGPSLPRALVALSLIRSLRRAGGCLMPWLLQQVAVP